MQSNPAGAVYGVLAVAALLVAESPREETYPRTVGAVAITLLLYWLAHSYAEYAGERLLNGERLEISGLGRMMLRELWIVLGAMLPLIVVLISWAGGSTLSEAITLATWAAAVIIASIEIGIGLNAGLTGRELVAQVVLGAALGLAIILLKVVLH
jgi:hypothetical protein